MARATGANYYALVPELRGKPCRRLVARIASRVRWNVILRFGFCRKPVTGRMADGTLGRCASEDSADVAGIAASPQVGTCQIEAGLDMVESDLLGTLLRGECAGNGDEKHGGCAEDRKEHRLNSA